MIFRLLVIGALAAPSANALETAAGADTVNASQVGINAKIEAVNAITKAGLNQILTCQKSGKLFDVTTGTCIAVEETLAKKIRKCSELNTRQRNLLYYNGIETIGDLVLRTEAELRVYNGAGPHFMATVNELLALLKLEFLDPDGDALEYAVTLYGGAEFVPTAHMYLWQERLDRLSFEYLQKYSTLGELAETSVMAYMVWRKSSVEEHPSQYGAQVQRVRDGLHRAGLHFRGEPSAYIK